MFTAGGQPYRLQNRVVRGGGGKGGGGNSPPPQPRSYVDPVDGTVFSESPMEGMFGGGVNPDGTPRLSASQQYNQHVTERRAGEKSASDAATAQTAADKAAGLTKWTGTRDTAYGDALNSVRDTFTKAGLNPDDYLASDINPALTRVKNSIVEGSANPAGAFTNTLGSDILNNVTTGKRTGAETAFNNIFKTDYTNSLIPDTGIDTNVNTILDEQFNPVAEQLKNALSRNTLNQTGYDAALGKLGEKRTAAYGTVRDLGRNILNEDRGYINDIVSGGRSDIAGLKANQAFDPLSYDTRARERATSEQGSFGGELRSKVGDSKFVDLTELLNAGGAVQGANNPTAINPAGGIAGTSPNYVDPLEEAKKGRGLGNTGAF